VPFQRSENTWFSMVGALARNAKHHELNALFTKRNASPSLPGSPDFTQSCEQIDAFVYKCESEIHVAMCASVHGHIRMHGCMCVCMHV